MSGRRGPDPKVRRPAARRTPGWATKTDAPPAPVIPAAAERRAGTQPHASAADDDIPQRSSGWIASQAIVRDATAASRSVRLGSRIGSAVRDDGRWVGALLSCPSPVFDPPEAVGLHFTGRSSRPDAHAQPSRAGAVKGSSAASLDRAEHGGTPAAANQNRAAHRPLPARRLSPQLPDIPHRPPSPRSWSGRRRPAAPARRGGRVHAA